MKMKKMEKRKKKMILFSMVLGAGALIIVATPGLSYMHICKCMCTASACLICLMP